VLLDIEKVLEFNGSRSKGEAAKNAAQPIESAGRAAAAK
jgi:hypothetical protein